MLKNILTLAPAVIMAWTATASAHEFWIEPLDYTPANGQLLQAEVRSGEFFSGDVFPYMPQRIVAVEVVEGDTRIPYRGRAGDFPALTHRADNGIIIVGYQSTPSTLTHSDFAEFQHFIAEDGLQWVEQAHHERELPTTSFEENFTRYAKTLVSVGGESGRDQHIGLPYELVVLSPLYASDTGTIELQLLAGGKPAQDTQVTIFSKKTGAPASDNPLKPRTDQYGQVSIPATAGTEYLASAVVMTEGEQVAWHSHWTSVTFEVPN
jgi:uncharacterized GH25 family protein